MKKLANVRRQLRIALENENENVQTTLAALGEMFKAARVIMGWLGDCAKVLTYSSFKKMNVDNMRI